LDKILRLVYPGVELPGIANVSALTALFTAADKYITSIPGVKAIVEDPFT